MDKILLTPSPSQLSHHSTLFILELPLWIIASLPSSLIFFALPFFTYGLTDTSLAILMLVAFFVTILLVGSLFDFLRFLDSPPTQNFPVSFIEKIDKQFLSSLSSAGLACRFDRIRVLMNDLSVGAHVRGTISPEVVISGGMLIGLIRGDISSKAILAHELSHIKHLDKFLPCLMFIYIINIIILAYAFIILNSIPFQTIVINIITTTFMLSIVSKRREYAADAHAIAAIGNPDEYIEVLKKTNKGKRLDQEGDFFHPSIQDRISAIRSDYPILGVSKMWFLVWSIYLFLIAPGMIGTAESEIEIIIGLSLFMLCFFGLALEGIKFFSYRKTIKSYSS